MQMLDFISSSGSTNVIIFNFFFLLQPLKASPLLCQEGKYSCGELPDTHPAPLSLTLLSKTGQGDEMEKLLGQADKDEEIAY